MNREKLGKYCKLRNGYAFKSKDFVESGIPIVRIGEISDGSINLKTAARIEEKESYDKYLIDKGAILIAMSGATTGKIGRFLHQVKAYQNQRVGSFIPDERKLSKEYLYFYLKTIGNLILQKAYGGGQPNISPREIESIRIPIPEKYEDQIRIATFLSRAEELIAKRKESIRLLDELLKSTFLEIFGDPVRNDKGWDEEPLSKFGTLNRGVSKHRPRNAPELLGGPYPLIQTGDVASAGLYIRSYNQTYSEIGLKQSKLWPKRTLCITIAANIAKTAILDFDACFPDSVVGFTPFPEESHPIYVHYLFKFFQRILEKNAPQAAQKNINLQILRNLPVPKPHIREQDPFVKLVEKVDSLKTKY
ncbi:MAG: restriction endonuclease subunit S, partial [Deltaproteobacteria bacterium]|nr:restriction endonuclease subunit S [Deltaproteobacteria bacterium]